MKTTLQCFVLCAGIASSSTLFGQTNQQASLPSTILTTTGKMYRSVKLLKVEPDGLSVEYAPQPGAIGMARIKFDVLPLSIQRDFGYSPARAAYHQAEEDRASRLWAEKMAREEEQAKQLRQEREAAEAKEEAAKEAARAEKLKEEAAMIVETNRPPTNAPNVIHNGYR